VDSIDDIVDDFQILHPFKEKRNRLKNSAWQLEERSYEVEPVQNKLKQCRHYG
jgi:hypothetical protein